MGNRLRALSSAAGMGLQIAGTYKPEDSVKFDNPPPPPIGSSPSQEEYHHKNTNYSAFSIRILLERGHPSGQ